MSESVAKSDRRWIMNGKFAASVVFDEANKEFDFLMEDGSHEVARFPNATKEEIATAIVDIQTCVPQTRKQR